MTPVGAYLAQDDIIRIALEHGVDMIHPGCILFCFVSLSHGSHLVKIGMDSCPRMRHLHGKLNRLAWPSSGLPPKSLMGSEIKPRPEHWVIIAHMISCIDDLHPTTAVKVGVPVVPGTPGPVESYTDGDAFIKEYGFPGKRGDIPVHMTSDTLLSSHHQSSYGRRRSRHARCP
jgi:pyruvate carboxylase